MFSKFAQKVKPFAPMVAVPTAAAAIVTFSSMWSNSEKQENGPSPAETKKSEPAWQNNIGL